MKFYVTGRSSEYDLVRDTFSKLKEKGHEVTFEWTELPMVKPYKDHPGESAKFAEQGIAGVLMADIYIIFSHQDGNGVYTELGAALASKIMQGSPIIYAIGKHQDAAMFNFHPAINWYPDLDSVLQEVGV